MFHSLNYALILFKKIKNKNLLRLYILLRKNILKWTETPKRSMVIEDYYMRALGKKGKEKEGRKMNGLN